MKKLTYVLFGLILITLLHGNVVAQDTGSYDNKTTNEQRDDHDNDTSYGWIGLLGLVGLAGFLRRDRRDDTRPVR